MNNQQMKKTTKILLAGGGSGGHVTPLKAIASELERATDGPYQIRVISDRRFLSQTQQIFADMPEVQLGTIFSGKFRRYNSRSLLWHLMHLPTIFYNLRDLFFIGIGVLQSLWLLLWHRPVVIFCKGGFVCVPIGLVARLLRIPLLIHDSDAHPGLTNRILASSARKIATGMPTEYYRYPKQKTLYTGIPVLAAFQPQSLAQQNKAKNEIGAEEGRPLLLVTGGGLGAERINQACTVIAAELIRQGWQIVQLTGKGKATLPEKKRRESSREVQKYWQIHEFVPMVSYVLAADVVVSRTGASAIQEFANAQKAVITIPGKQLSGGHQIKNAAMLHKARAAVVIDEDEVAKSPQLLLDEIRALLVRGKDKTLATQLHTKFAKPQAARQLAQLIHEYAHL